MRLSIFFRLIRVSFVLLICIVVACEKNRGADTISDAANIVYTNAKVVTVDDRFSVAEAFAVTGGRFSAVGTNSAIDALIGPNTKVIDLAGRVVLPGFIDSHPHAVHRGRRSLEAPSLAGLSSIAAIVQRISEAADTRTPGEWITPSPIGEPPDFFHLPESLEEHRWPTRIELDQAAPKNPVYIPTPTTWPNPAIFNSAALQLLDIDERNPAGITVERDPDTGKPTGIIHGLNIYNRHSPLLAKLRSLLPPTPSEVQHEGLKRVLRDNIAVGVTTIYEAHGNLTPRQLHEEIRSLRARGEPVTRIVSTYEIPRGMPVSKVDEWMKTVTDAMGAGTGDEFAKIVGITVGMDGATQFGAALMNKPYLDPNGELGNGESAHSTEELAEIARLAALNDLRLNIVVAGTKTCDMVVTALEKVHEHTPIDSRQWVVQHFQHPTRDLIARLNDMGVVATTYSNVDFSKGAKTYIDRFPGQDIWRTVIPLRWWIDGNVTVAQSTDGAHYQPMFTIWESLVRVDGRTGQSLLTPAKTISREEAIRIYTINGAKVLQWDDQIGSIETGKLADFVVLDRDILTIPVDEIRDTEVILTAISGKVFHDSLSLTKSGNRIEAGAAN